MDFLEELAHSWGKSPEQKKREKEYNAKYYQENKERWKNVTSGNIVPDSIKEYVKEARKPGASTYLPQGVYPKTDKEEREWNAAGLVYDEDKGQWKLVSDGYAGQRREFLAKRKRGEIQKSIAESYSKNEKAKMDIAKKRAAANEKKKPYLDALAADKKRRDAEAAQSKAKKARKFIDGVTEEAINNGKTFLKDFFGWG